MIFKVFGGGCALFICKHYSILLIYLVSVEYPGTNKSDDCSELMCCVLSRSLVSDSL